MNKSEKLSLIEGVFDEEEARDILMNIFATKINFHQLKNFSSQERFGIEDPTAISRIPELQKNIAKLEKILNEAKKHNKQMVISSEITIVLKDVE